MSENRSELLNLYEFTRAELTELLADWGQPAYRAEQLWQWMYEHLAADFAEMTNLPRQLRDHLARRATLQPLRVLEELVSRDQLTRKYLLELPDGETIESVLMLYEHRRTACISTQVGCPIRCDFCATGKSGFRRNLTAG
ncbi:MAG: 23S rRNA (adenine(2503)-C2)-methyltransferase, partial [Anaerolineae bacterium]